MNFDFEIYLVTIRNLKFFKQIVELPDKMSNLKYKLTMLTLSRVAHLYLMALSVLNN